MQVLAAGCEQVFAMTGKESLDFTIRIGSTPTFLYFDLYLYSAYAAHYVSYTHRLIGRFHAQQKYDVHPVSTSNSPAAFYCRNSVNCQVFEYVCFKFTATVCKPRHAIDHATSIFREGSTLRCIHKYVIPS